MKYDYQAMAFAASCQRPLGYQFTVPTPEKEHFQVIGIKTVSGCRSLDIFLWNLKEKYDLTKFNDHIQAIKELREASAAPEHQDWSGGKYQRELIGGGVVSQYGLSQAKHLVDRLIAVYEIKIS